jgi:hypothetical protein
VAPWLPKTGRLYTLHGVSALASAAYIRPRADSTIRALIPA